jgi:hypothetical protein
MLESMARLSLLQSCIRLGHQTGGIAIIVSGYHDWNLIGASRLALPCFAMPASTDVGRCAAVRLIECKQRRTWCASLPCFRDVMLTVSFRAIRFVILQGYSSNLALMLDHLLRRSLYCE